MEMFKPLMTRQENNPTPGIRCLLPMPPMSALGQNYQTVARDMLLQIESCIPSLGSAGQNVSFLMAKIYFDRNEYFQAMNMLKEVPQEDFIEIERITNEEALPRKDIRPRGIAHDVGGISTRSRCSYRTGIKAITRQPTANQDRELFETVVEQFQMPRKPFEDAALQQAHLPGPIPCFGAISFWPPPSSPSPSKNKMVVP